MEPLRLLQFCHIPSDKNPAAVRDSHSDVTLTSSETTTTTNKDRHAVETDDEDSFFDLDFTVPLKKNQKNSSKHDDFLPRKPLPNPLSPPKLRLHMLLKNSEPEKTEVQIFSLLNVRNSPASKLQKQRRFPKVVIQKYLKLINPFYSRASKKTYTQTGKSTNEISKTTPFSSPRKQVVEKQGTRPACNHLGKSRSASSGVRAAPVLPARRDDSLMLQHDGIQSAILHCKRSYNSSTEFCALPRSASDPSDEVSVNPCRSSREEVKTRNSI